VKNLHDDVQFDIASMGAAVEAISRIPTSARRETAFKWLQARVCSDIAKLREEERIERIAECAAAIVGE
jgi:hypothetical protein